MAKITIICPSCRNKLSFTEVSGYRDMLVTCPVCGYKAKAGVFMSSGINSCGTNTGGAPTELLNSDKPRQTGTAYIRLVAGGRKFPLAKGHNIIGRKATTGNADIQIEGDMYMSRSHVRIDVIPEIGEYRLVEISSKNIVQLNNKPLNRGDIVLLHSGDRLIFGKTEVIFELADNDATQLLDIRQS